jgi:hypothetical protein
VAEQLYQLWLDTALFMSMTSLFLKSLLGNDNDEAAIAAHQKVL